MENQKMMMMLKPFLSLNYGSNFLSQEMCQSAVMAPEADFRIAHKFGRKIVLEAFERKVVS